jgi:hypothetical protein
MITLPGEYVSARTVLLDALYAIGSQRNAVILVGAQAVYVHAGMGDLVLAPTTTDGDLALRTDELGDTPELARALIAGDFRPGAQPGTWIGRGGVAVDLMVVPHQGGRRKPTARAASLPVHGKNVARITRGLEPALIDHSVVLIAGLDEADARFVELAVAGPAALLVAKLIKLEERRASAAGGKANRVRTKDALDIFRLLRFVTIETFVEGFDRHRTEPYAANVSRQAVAFLRAHGTREADFLAGLAAAEIAGDPTIAPSFSVIANELLEALGPKGWTN